MNAGNSIVRSGAGDFSILNYDCHCQHFKLHVVPGCLYLAFDGHSHSLLICVH